MNYEITEKNAEVLFRYNPSKKIKKTFNKKTSKENPFRILKSLNLG